MSERREKERKGEGKGREVQGKGREENSEGKEGSPLTFITKFTPMNVTYFYNFGPLSISGMNKARDFKISVLIEHQACKPENAKVGQNGCGLLHVTYFYNFVPILNLSNG